MDACTIDEDKAHPQAILLYFRSEGRASFHYSKLVMIQLCPSCKLHMDACTIDEDEDNAISSYHNDLFSLLKIGNDSTLPFLQITHCVKIDLFISK